MGTVPPNDSILIAAQSGDRHAQAALLSSLQDPWYRLCLSMLGNADLARDATQETAVRFLTNLPQFQGKSQLKTWSMGIAINVVREMRRATRPTVDLEYDPPIRFDSDATPPTPMELAQTAEATGELKAMLGGLSDRQREVIILRFFEELTVEQTAKAMRCATGTVKATVHQALRVLRERLAKMV